MEVVSTAETSCFCNEGQMVFNVYVVLT